MQSLPRLLKPYSPPEVFPSLRKPCPYHHTPGRQLSPAPSSFSIGKQFLRQRLILSYLFYQSRCLAVNHRNGPWLTCRARNLLVSQWLAESAGDLESQAQENSHGQLRTQPGHCRRKSVRSQTSALLALGTHPRPCHHPRSSASSEASVRSCLSAHLPQNSRRGICVCPTDQVLGARAQLPGRGEQGGRVRGRQALQLAHPHRNAGLPSTQPEDALPALPPASYCKSQLPFAHSKKPP